jgi:hypothetical protein
MFNREIVIIIEPGRDVRIPHTLLRAICDLRSSHLATWNRLACASRLALSPLEADKFRNYETF